MTDITIPPEALEAAARAICEADFNLPHDAPDFHVYARAACLAMLEAWPGMQKIYRSEDEKLFSIILPLPEKETSA